MTTGQLAIRPLGAPASAFQLERTQFSLAGDWDVRFQTLEVRSLFYFKGDRPHEIATPPELCGPLFQFVRSIPTEDFRKSEALQSLQLAGATFEASDIPFPAGISFGSIHYGTRSMTVSLTWLRGLQFQCQCAGTLQRISEDPRVLDGAAFEFAIELPFDGVWLESANAEDRPKIEHFYDSLFGHLNLITELDQHADGVVLRAHA
jgi:hypothetical protein